MCLSSIDKKTRKGNGTGYKVFAMDDSYHPHFCIQGGRARVRYGVWMKDESRGVILIASTSHYKKGYHIYVNLSDAEHWHDRNYEVIRKVSYKNVVTSGAQIGKRIIVAREIYIHKGNPIMEETEPETKK